MKHLALAGLFLSVLVAAMAAPNAGAWAEVAEKPYGDDAGARIDTYMASFDGGSYANWREMSYVTARYDDDSWIFSVWDEDDTVGIEDNGFMSTSIGTKVICRFYNDSGAPGCNPLASSGYTTSKIFDMKLTTANATLYPDLVAEYSSLLTTFGGSMRYRVTGKIANFWLQNIPEGAKNCSLYVDTNKNESQELEDLVEENIYEWRTCTSTEPVVHAWSEYGYYDVRLEVVLEDDSLVQFTKRFYIDGRNFEGGFAPGAEDEDGSAEEPLADANGLLSDCFTEEFPFVNLESCASNLAVVGNMLTFGAINWGTKLDATPCKTLTVVDDWMNLDNPSVCPMVPEYVRNVVTPFVTFALGLMMIRWLSKQSGGNG